MTEEEFIRKYDNSEDFTEEEIEEVITTFSTLTNNFVTQKVFSVGERYFSVDYLQDLFKYHDINYCDQPCEVDKITTQVTQTTFKKKV